MSELRSELRTEVLDWVEQGRIPLDRLSTALQAAGVTPTRRDWRVFIDQLTLWLGALFCGASVIFFIAYNWDALGRFAKFGLVELLILASMLMYWRLDIDKMSGKAMLLFATLLTGALLALVGQTYQTGADTFELFAAWAAAVFVWVAISRVAAMWMVWLSILNLAAIFYFQTFGGFFGMLFSTDKKLWTLFVLNTTALCVYETAVLFGVTWLHERWPARILAIASGGNLTALMMLAILDFKELHGAALIYLFYFLWLAAAYAYYRHHLVDVFVLAGGALSVIIVVTVFLSKHLLGHSDASGMLLIGLVVICMSAVSGFWLKSIANEERV